MSGAVLITGGAGNLACQLAFVLTTKGYRVVLADVLEKPLHDCPPECLYQQVDIRQQARVHHLVESERPEMVVHFASLLSGSSEADRAMAWDVNLNGAFYLFEAALANGVRQVFFPSSVASFGSPLPDTVTDECPQWPEGFYGMTKVAVERLGHYYFRRHGIDFRCLRVPIVVSPYAHAGAASSYASMAFLQSKRNHEFCFQVRPESSPVLIYVKDLIRAIVELMEAPSDRLRRRVYNLPGISPTAAEIAEAIARRIPKARLTFEPDGFIASLIASWPRAFDPMAAREDWGWQVEYTLDRMADDLLHGPD